MESAVALPRRQAEAMIAHARAGAPDEVCGLVAGDGEGRIVAILPVPNGAAEKRHRYHMEPMAQHRAFTEMERLGWTLVGLYHSHPASAAHPSPTDQRMAFDPYDDAPLYPGALYFIVSLADPDRPDIRAFRLPAPDRVVELSLALG